MSFVGPFFLIVFVLGFAELYFLIAATKVVGFIGTLALCVLTGLLGGALVRYQGIQTLLDIRKTSAQGRVPALEIVSGLVLLIVGAMLITPGFITDTFGFSMLIPAIRLGVARQVIRRFRPIGA